VNHLEVEAIPDA
jgi:hypothetical protein